MSLRSSSVKKKQKIATLITKSVIAVIGILTLSVLFQSYQISSNIIAQEVQRTAVQTSRLIQNLFNFRLSLLQINQDSSAKNANLVKAIRQDSNQLLDLYFLGVDQLEPINTPDIRFISNVDELIWEDGNAQFYGIARLDLAKMARKIALSSNWHMIKSGSIYLMARRSPIIDLVSGEVVGLLHIATVLNNNFILAETLRDGSNSENLLITAGENVLASTLNGNEIYSENDVFADSINQDDFEELIVSRTNLTIEGVPIYIDVLSVQSNESVLKLRDNFYFWMVFALIAMACISVLTRWWLHRRVKNEISSLMIYTHKAAEIGSYELFSGSKIYEFDHFGRTLEHTFKLLSEQEKQFEDLFNFSLSPIIVWDIDGQPIKMNPSAQKHFMHLNESQECLFDALQLELQPKIRQAAKEETFREVNVEVGNKVFRWNLSPIVFEQKIESIITQGQDITTIAEAAKQSRLARQEAEETARIRAEFLAKMSHELRTPLNGILGVSQLLKRTVHSQEQCEQVDVLCNSGEHLLAVLNDILDFSKIEQGQFRIQEADFKLVEVISAVESIYRPLCAAKKIDFKIEGNIASDMVIHSDQVRLNQILFNLLNNATKFTHQGSICVEFLHKQVNDLDYLHIALSDTGIGIKEQDLESIFEPFMQAESNTTREYGGSGLGLAIVKSLVEMLGGCISVESQFGVGTRFYIELPLTLGHASHDAFTAEGVLPSNMFESTIKVLLVEDNHTNAFIAQAFCKKYKMEVIWVEDGLQAIDYLKEHRVDLILMDNQLPYLGGVETTQLIKYELGLDTPVYACTADGMPSTSEAFLKAGAEYVIVKPIKEKALHAAFSHFQQQRVNLNRNLRS
ncbi:ATP-binding protein [Vibrio aestuarianus]|uniref:quorum-sensing autoinducer 2 sensor kinase/phosphatase LuxQ n=1 Tax=Vibrio aestuarianus TaxID=28171 RepID=UPI00237C7B9F|nr:quorum-sensing autoinducer 2 sensor kinase/phosphatase LuxQ [Vibrio aestuarianus]MDE1264995.1 ATP-binding protein [Vibrio aestuarianus]MDE1296923.1 ATP-binding protein [Vibrio aestuarianus]MDE1324794.1 ATP-binding protein [Vibrio aestuarianus]